MQQPRTITIIPAKVEYVTMKVGIYCRVSTASQDQLDSLVAQVSSLTQLVARRPDWKLYDTYIDIRSGNSTAHRNEFTRMLSDCQTGKIEMIVTKSVSRFGRNTAEVLAALNMLKTTGVNVFFETENLYSQDGSSALLISIIEAFAQAESTARSENIKWGIYRKLNSGESKIFYRKCFGYKNDEKGQLIINEEEATTVRLIFDLYMAGFSVVALIKELKRLNIKSASGKETWNKRAIELLLSNEKYTGDVLAGKTVSGEFPNNKRRNNREGQHSGRYVLAEAVPPIISKEQFEAVQKEKARRSNIERTEKGSVRKPKRYTVQVIKKAEVGSHAEGLAGQNQAEGEVSIGKDYSK